MNTAHHDNQSISLSLVGIACAVLGAAALAFLLAFISFGVLAPLGAGLLGLAIMLSGFWLLLNRKSRASRYVAVALIFAPILCVLFYAFTGFFSQVHG